MTEPLPTIVEPDSPGASLLTWARQHGSELDRLLDASGALLLRGFAVGGTAGFGRLLDAASKSGAVPYLYQSTPRTALGNRVYTATEYPPSETIPLHNENAYQRVWPMRLFFFSVIVAAAGGQTPLADTVRVTARIDADVVERFEKRGVMYVRNYREGLDLPWQRVFQTDDRASVEAYARAHDIAVEWLPNGELRTRQVCQGIARHPRSGERIWMNQAHLFHVSSLADEARDSLRTLMREEELPRNALYGDGSPIEPDLLEHVRAAFSAEEVTFDWSSGDVLIVDNMRVSHGRRPFSGERKVLVAMTDPHPA
jgi:alpha-ketoglutarate-dependent taurine dioxygenase